MMEQDKGSSWFPWILPVIIAAAFLFAAGEKLPISWDFRNNLWGPVHLLAHGQSPYNIDVLFEAGNALWLPMAVGFFWPLGLLPLKHANSLWLLLNIVSAALSTWLVIRSYKRSFVVQAVSIVLVLLSVPAISHFGLGQFSFFSILLYMAAVYYRERIPDLISALLVALALTKPQLGVLVVMGLLLHQFSTQGGFKTIRLLVLIAAGLLVLSLPLFIAYPDWISDFIVQWTRNPVWEHPSSLGILQEVFPGYGRYVWLMLAAGLMWVNLRLWLKKTPEEAVLWSLALTPLVSPYIWSWDFVLILPLFVSRLNRFRSRAAVLFLSGGYIIGWFFMVKLRMDGASDFRQWWFPWFLIGLILAACFLERRTRKAAQNFSTVDER